MGFIPLRPRLVSSRHTGAPVRHQNEDTAVTVASGSTLWSIAAEHLGPAATDWEVAREWLRWHQENQLLIGEDPAQLRPGTVLRPPPR
ncbi:MAG: LysM peptidoglycan-binding domain-containing protein [Nesterenkonia sp.]